VSSKAAKGFKVLVVEDSETTLENLLQELRELGYLVKGVSSAEEALDTLRSDSFNLALIDMVLPGKGGLWLIGEIQKNFKTVICVLLTANQSVKTGVEAAEIGAKGYLIKPLKPEELQIAIERARKLFEIEKNRHTEQIELAQELKELKERSDRSADSENLSSSTD